MGIVGFGSDASRRVLAVFRGNEKCGGAHPRSKERRKWGSGSRVEAVRTCGSGSGKESGVWMMIPPCAIEGAALLCWLSTLLSASLCDI